MLGFEIASSIMFQYYVSSIKASNSLPLEEGGRVFL
jgi:hypothetical protein